MKARRVEERDRLKRDILRDFCLACKELEAQFARLEAGGRLSFALLRSLVGDAVSKGSLWRLKDTSHHLFGSASAHATAVPSGMRQGSYARQGHDMPAQGAPGQSMGPGQKFEPAQKFEPGQKGDAASEAGSAEKEEAGLLLDWTIGYVFHECVKMTEDAYQLQHYGPRLPKNCLQSGRSCSVCPSAQRELEPIIEESRLSLRREAERVGRLLQQARRLFAHYLAGDWNNLYLARFLYERADLVRATFHSNNDELLRMIYGDRQYLLPLQAARAFAEAGSYEKALPPANEALKLAPDEKAAQELLKTIKSSTGE